MKMIILDILFWMLYAVAGLAVCLALTAYALMAIAVIRIGLNADKWTVDRKDPLSTMRHKGILRELGPLENVMVTFAGDYRYVAFNKGAAGFSIRGLEEGDPGMRRYSERDWDLVTKTTVSSSSSVQSQWGWLSPIYCFRWLAYKLTGRHVVRIWFPFFTHGWWEMYKPELREYERARPKGQEMSQHMLVLGQNIDVGKGERPNPKKDSANVWMVADTTDHARWKFTHEYITSSFPTKAGYELKGHFLFVFEHTNWHRAFRWPDWSRRINGSTDEAFGTIVRSGDLESVYAAKDKSAVTAFQEAVTKHLTDAATKSFEKVVVTDDQGRYLSEAGNVVTVERNAAQRKLSVLEMLGLKLSDVSLVDLVPADEETEKAITKLMAILPEGKNRAEVAGMLVEAQIDVLDEVDPATAQALAGIIGAQQIARAGKVDYLLGAGGSPTVDQAMLNRINKILAGGGDE